MVGQAWGQAMALDAECRNEENSAEETRQQAAALPFRFRGGKLQFCLVTVRRGKTWTIPKGNIEVEESGSECAVREAFEEAGLEGRVLDTPLSSYLDTKRKRSLQVTVWLMDVERCRKKWPEKKSRERRWVSPKKAIGLLKRPRLVAVIVDGMRRLA
jgi:8-oxo-dGTP pyrophosphatase MutT (NUDIX family)